ncbi:MULTISPECIES: YlbF family regulator [Bacillaceae]|uniref:YlbF family regulator n=1 Tax=Evansella alkalicola TaxID=745819 RepID=A0ABS6JPQ4_9BACI|nr:MULTISPECIES: YlbF family regulator [Bacillaceae]MBU9720468.1 YlbF family regulator [Bacillus alkalicola]
MVTTMTNVDVLQQAYDFGEIVTSSEIFHKYIDAKRSLTVNNEAQLLIKEFTVIKEKYEEVQRFGKYHPDFSKVTKDVREMKRKVDTHPVVVDFKKTEDDLHQLLVEVSQIIANAVSSQIKVPTGNPFFDTATSCSGGCGSGGSCGCK